MKCPIGIVSPALAWLVALGALPAPRAVAAQEAEETPPAARDTTIPPGMPAPETRPRRKGCPLVLETAENLNRIERGGAYVYYFGGGMLWRCGNAEMVADSAVRYEAAARVEMMGDVEYRDTIRTLDSDFLTYYELPDLVVATGNVHLTRLSSGSTLDGPRIEFLRAVSGRGEEVTTATGRPHLTLYPGGEEDRERPPFDVDADVTILAGEEMATGRGDVVIRRPDLLARADSAIFDIANGGGVLYGSPEVEGRGFQLSGDTIRLRFEDDDLREVRARGRAYAAGESFEVMAEEIRARIEEEKAKEVWAYGPGRSLATSSSYRVYGDSLRFVLSDGRIDSVLAVGEATAVEVPESEERGAAGTGERLADRDGIAGAPPERAPLPAPDAVTDPLAPTAVDVASDTTVAAPDTAVVRRVGRARPESVPSPRLRVEGRTSWMEGDTLFAIFQPAPPDDSPPDTSGVPTGAPAAAADESRPPAGEEPEAGDEAANAEEREAPGEGGVTPDSASLPAMDSTGRRVERIRVVGVEASARAFYATVSDSARTTEPSRNYMIGREIEILFREGRAVEVRGDRAIGVYLDPGEQAEGAGSRRERGVALDTTGMTADSSAVPDSTVVPDTTGAERDPAPIPAAGATGAGAEADRRAGGPGGPRVVTGHPLRRRRTR